MMLKYCGYVLSRGGMSSGPRTPSPGGGRAGGSQSELPDWDRLRLSLHNAIGELLHSWGLLAAFRRRHAGRPAAARSPGAAPSPPHRRREHIEMASFSYRVAPSSPLVGGSPALCRVSSSPVVSSLADRRQQWREVSDTDSGVCVDRDSTVGSGSGVTVWEEFDGTGTGEGHRFTAATLDQPSWCDCCGDLLWSDTVICRCSAVSPAHATRGRGGGGGLCA
ncbi:hypothetical protein FJT64_018591 [Amphibalanus amphitrite]|uniref:Uncharacterized protein n=1 Tax=Amphibalanus amphitrite TaxID=1232801 RepID=A0A6A4WYL4_AMPAM|nr:hypothetical protein FJT64_018591 [Amphibalanus amphitrite]